MNDRFKNWMSLDDPIAWWEEDAAEVPSDHMLFLSPGANPFDALAEAVERERLKGMRLERQATCTWLTERVTLTDGDDPALLGSLARRIAEGEPWINRNRFGNDPGGDWVPAVVARDQRLAGMLDERTAVLALLDARVNAMGEQAEAARQRGDGDKQASLMAQAFQGALLAKLIRGGVHRDATAQ